MSPELAAALAAVTLALCRELLALLDQRRRRRGELRTRRGDGGELPPTEDPSDRR